MTPALSNDDSLNNPRKSWVKCSLCGFEFAENEAQSACENCPMKKGCKLIKCPNCGFETPPEPLWLKSMRKPRKINEDK